MDISIVVPAYNEEKRIKRTLNKIYDYFEKSRLQFEIIIVDDGSKDDMEKVVKEFAQTHSEVKLIKYEKNKGKGAAVKTGVLASKGNLVLFSDADLSTPIEEFEKLKQAIDKGYDIAIGSRGLPESRIFIHQSKSREFSGKLFNFFIRIFIKLPFEDTQCGFKLFKHNVTEQIFPQLTIFRFVFDVEILWLARKFNYKIKEVPIVWENSNKSSVSFFSTSPSVMKEMIKIYIRFLKN